MAVISPEAPRSRWLAPVLLLLGSLFFVLIWIPMTHMGHLLFKYFTYHDIRWGDTPTDFSQKNNEKMKQALQVKVSWAADHINGQGTKTWLDIATESPKKD